MTKNNKIVVAVAVVVVAIVIVLGVGMFVAPHALSGTHVGSTTAGGAGPSQASGTLFSSFRFAQSSYLISENATLSASGKVATGDFNMTTAQLANGSTEYSLKFGETGAVYNATVGRGEKLYYIDTNLGDDASSSDVYLGDDGYAVVNATGYIVTLRYPLPNT